MSTPHPTRHAPRRRWPWIVSAVVLALAVLVWWRVGHSDRAGGGPDGRAGGMQGPQTVTASVARVQAMPVWWQALGTVTPRSLVNVMPRVSGLLQSVNYTQGQRVQAGQVLAVIDPRPYRIAVAQAEAQLEQTRAQLAGAQRDLARYETLLKQDSIAEQTVSDQRATVAQLKATLDANRAALGNARLQLDWTRITAPVSGLAGLRPVDAGNMVSTSGVVGSNTTASATATASGATPIAVIAQVQPVDVVFALPQQQIAEVVAPLMAGKELVAQAWDARNARTLATGRLLAADNQINVATGTLNLRAEFANPDLALYPNAFVNVHLLVRTIPDALMVPTTAVAVGAPGTYVYVIGADDRVAMRKVTTGGTLGSLTRIASGLKAGERVVTDGLDRLRDGAAVKVVPSAPKGTDMPAAGTRANAGRTGTADGAR